jgi:predicted phage terminase large subunit-like protein
MKATSYATSPAPNDPAWIVYDPAEPRPMPDDLPTTVRRLTAALCKKSLGDFVIEAWPHVPELQNTPFSWGWHLDVLCDHVQAVLEPQKWGRKRPVIEGVLPRTGLKRQDAAKNARDLIINVPPGTMKSLILNVFAPAWMWAETPGWSVLCSSGNESAALRDSSRCRDLIKSDWYRQLFEPKWGFSPENDGKTKFQNTAGGVRMVRTVGQAITGDRTDCFPEGTLVSTEHGERAIETLRPGDRVWGFDGQAPVLRKVQGVRTLPSRPLVRIVTGDRREIECTYDHRVYTSEGYVEAQKLQPGNRLLGLQQSASPSRPEVLDLLNRCGEDRRTSDVCGVPNEVHAPGVSGSTTTTGRRSDGEFLLDRVQNSRLSPHQPGAEDARVSLSKLHEGDARTQRPQVLLGRVHSEAPTSIAGQDVPAMWSSLRAPQPPSGVLLGCLRESSTLPADDRFGKLEISRADGLLALVSADAAPDSRARSSMPGLRCREREQTRGPGEPFESDRPSHQPRPLGQPSGEPDSALRPVSQHPPQVEADAVSVVCRSRRRALAVYDIQVEGTRNFFANGVLVHNCIFIDDPNDAQQIRSKAYRDRINEDWWSGAMSNRLNNTKTGVRIIIMQRLHEEDLVGYILEKNKLKADGGTWEQIVIPMEWEALPAPTEPDRDTGRRKVKHVPGQNCDTFLGWRDPRDIEGELLMPHRFSPEYVKAEKTEKGSAGYAGQYQQRPSPKEGNKFKKEWWRYWRHDGAPLVQPNRPKDASQVAAVLLPSPEQWEDSVESWDFTFKGKETNDWVVGVKVVKVGAYRFVLDRWRKHADFGRSKLGLIELRARPPRVQGPIVIEAKANGDAVLNDLHAFVPGLVEETPKDGKEQRASVLEPQVEAGQWFLPDGVEWLDEWIDEFAAFPNGRHDDQVDALSQACARFGQDSELERAKKLFGFA